MAERLAGQGLLVIRANFAWMDKAEQAGKPCPPPRIDRLLTELRAWLEDLDRPLVLVGKSLGGRVASLLAADGGSGLVRGCVCLGYPFHPPARPQQWRTDHWPRVGLPMLVMQGERDLFGKRDEVVTHLAGLAESVSASVRIRWWSDADHDLVPGKRSGLDAGQQLQDCSREVAEFVRECLGAGADPAVQVPVRVIR